ncbi:UNVERIFIED_CONTAM: hypothetical protein GTU68_045259 [Idotea baltica]|nr:hypothetical protein [Idotea baltica]
MEFSNIITSLEPSATLSISKKVRELKAEGKDVIGLTLGEPDFDTPVHIREAAKKALDDGYTHYPPVTGYPELRQAIVDKLLRDNGLTYSPSQIVVSTGAKQSLYNIILAMINPGDGAILPAPFWVSYHGILHLAQADISILPTTFESNYKISPEQLEAAIKPHTKLFFLTSPSNPSGSMYSREEIAALVEVLERHPQVKIISDEIYEYITFGLEHISIASFESVYDRTIVVNGFSKGYAMTGWRLGYIAAPLEIAKLSEKLQGQCTSGANAFAQQGAIAALTGGMESVIEMRDEFHSRRDMMFDKLSAIKGLKVNKPDGAFYFYPDFAEFLGRSTPNGTIIQNIDELCMFLIESTGLALVTGSAFGTSSHARLSYAYSVETLNDAIGRLSEGLSRLKIPALK